MNCCRLILKLGMETEEVAFLPMANFHTASPFQAPKLGSAKDIRQRESKHRAASEVFLTQNEHFD